MYIYALYHGIICMILLLPNMVGPFPIPLAPPHFCCPYLRLECSLERTQFNCFIIVSDLLWHYHALLSTRLLPAIVQAIALVKVMKTLQVSYFNDALCVSMRGELH